MENELTAEQWLAIRKKAALHIDPGTADVMWQHGQTLDPYGIYPDLPKELQQVGRNYFARASGSDVWVSFDDIPDAIRNGLREKHKRKLAFHVDLAALLIDDTDQGTPEA